MANAVGQFLHLVLWLFLALMFVRLIVDWVQVFARSWTPHGPLLVLLEVIYTVTDPPIRFLRRFLPPLRIGTVALDVSFLLVMLGGYVLLALNDSLLL